MKRDRYIYIFLLIICTSCEKEFLNKTPDEDLTVEDIFTERGYTEDFLTSIYSHLPYEMNFVDVPWASTPFVTASDEMDVPWPEKFSELMNSGAWNPSNTMTFMWTNNYQGIRKANLFLDNIAKVPMNESDKQRWIGEVTFLRAFYHFNLLRTYGPIPLMDYAMTTDDDFTSVKRNSLEECVNFIINECEKAAPLLDEVTSDQLGRVNPIAPLALKARVLLYMASPLWNGNPDYAGFEDKDGVKLFPDYDPERWQVAADAAKECINKAEASGHQLYRSADGDPVSSYQQLFLENWNEEVIFARNMGHFPNLDQCSFPVGMGGFSGYCPTQELVDAYQMANGLPITDGNSGYEEEGYVDEAHPKGYYPAGIHNMYVGREPRFYASINYNGAFWTERQIEFFHAGRDSRRVGGRDHAITGYLMKKWAQPSTNIPQGRFSIRTWIFFRLGEQYLNYAEALNEAQGPVADVYHYVNEIRNRAGLPDLPDGLTQDEMRERIRHERRIELAFETHRYFDTRRWKIAESTANGPIHGMNIATGASLQDDSFYERTVVENRQFESPKHYLFPIPQDEINKNPNLIQNPGWQ